MHVYSKNATVMYCTRLPRANALNCVGGETCSSGGIEQVPGCRTCELMTRLVLSTCIGCLLPESS